MNILDILFSISEYLYKMPASLYASMAHRDAGDNISVIFFCPNMVQCDGIEEKEGDV